MGVLRTHAEQQDLRAMKQTEELGIACIASHPDAKTQEAMDDIGLIEADATNLRRIADQFEAGLAEPAMVVG